MKKLYPLVMLVAAFVTQSAFAGGDHHPKYGGQVQETTSYDLELVAKDKELTLYVADHKGKKTDTKEATALVLTGKSKETVKLTAGADGVLKGAGSVAVSADTKIIVSIQAAGKTEQARFAPLQKEKTEEHKGHKH